MEKWKKEKAELASVKEKQKEVLEKMLGQYRGKIKNVELRLYTLSIDSTRN